MTRPDIGLWHGLDTETQDGRAVLVCKTGPAVGVSLVESPGAGFQFGPDWGDLVFPKSFDACAKFLLDGCPANGTVRYAAFNMDYDARALCAFLPKRCLKELHYNGSTVWRGYYVSYMKRKEFSVKRDNRRAAVYDVWQFYQAGTLKATLAKVFPGEAEVQKLDIPKSWLPRMAWALEHHPETVIAYCRRDGDGARRLMVNVGRQFEGLSLDFTRPLSPATMAAKYFAPRIRFWIPRSHNSIARRAYNGGRIEVYRRGRFEGDFFCYDINSAYPAAMSGLLDPHGCRHVRTDRVSPDAAYGTYLVSLRVPDHCYFPPVPVESKDVGLIYPAGIIQRWVDRVTLDGLTRDGFDPEVKQAFEWLIEKETPLFPDLGHLYAERKARPDINLALKIVLNGLYGKIAQAVDVYSETSEITREVKWAAGRFVKRVQKYASYTHYALASHVTSTCRERIRRAMVAAGRGRVLFAMTDGICTDGYVGGLGIGSGLGDWSIKARVAEAIVVGTGIYALRHHELCGCELCLAPGRPEQVWVERMRGLRGARPLRDLLTSKRARWPIRVSVIDTLADAVREKMARLNVIRYAKRSFDVNFDRKRHWPRPWKSAAELLNPELAQDSEPLILL